MPVDTPPALSHPLLSGADAAGVRAIIGTARPRQVHAGQLLSTPDQERRSVNLVLAGLLRAFELTPDGREVLIEIIGPGGFDGLLAARGFHGHFTEALEDSLILSLTSGQVDMLCADPAIGRRLIDLLLGRVERREEQLRLFAIREPEKRLASLLLRLSEVLGRRDGSGMLIEHRLTHQDLANMLGIRRETITHAMHRLAERGAVRSTRGHLVLDVAELERDVADDRLLQAGATAVRAS